MASFGSLLAGRQKEDLKGALAGGGAATLMLPRTAGCKDVRVAVLHHAVDPKTVVMNS